jgi:multidrug efflux pump subunit AcrB
MTALLMAAILLVGRVAYTQLPVSALPQVDYPTIQVLTMYPGASPAITASTITLAINAAQTYLPSDLPSPPIYSKSNPADAPVLTLAITSDSMPLSQVEDIVDTRLAPKISQLSGIGLVSISGGQKPAVRVQVNPSALASYGINMEDVRTALTQASVNSAKGDFDGPDQDYQIDANDQIRQAAWMNKTPAAILNIQGQPGANTIKVVDSIPVQDTGVIQGISQAPQSISYKAMAAKQKQLSDVMLKDPAVESLSSFIGADGTNTTLNSGRISINLKPLGQRDISASDVIRRLQKSLEQAPGIHLYICSRCRISRSTTASVVHSINTHSKTPTQRS